MEKYSTVTIRGSKESKKVQIGSDLKPEIVSTLVEKWQSLVDTAAKIVNVPSGLIMRLNEETIEVFIRSKTEGNPYKVGEKADLIYGLYCETVIGTQKQLLIPDATQSPVWKIGNPDVEINMISYLGLPINWPDGEVFGTICLLDSKENHYSKDFIDLLNEVKQHIETDLQLLLANNKLEEINRQLDQTNNTKSRFLSLISHDVRGGIGTLAEFLKLIILNYDSYSKSELKTMLHSLSENVSSSFLTLENLLNWSKNDLVQIEPDKVPVNVVDIIEFLLLHFEQAISIKDLQIKKEYCSSSATISADEQMMTVVIRNILSNAVKYTENKGTITIRVLQSDKHLTIEIEDTGIGMDKSLADQLFSYNKSHRTQGTIGESSAGIGLMLAKEFADKNNAEITVESEVGKGTKFKITI